MSDFFIMKTRRTEQEATNLSTISYEHFAALDSKLKQSLKSFSVQKLARNTKNFTLTGSCFEFVCWNFS